MSDISQYNGSGVVAMCGKNCVAVASDMRYGIRQTTIADDMERIFEMHDKLLVGLPGLATDMLTLKNKFNQRVKLYELREERKMKPTVFAKMVSGMLYEHRFGPFFCEPIVAGLEDTKDEKNVPFICAMDLIGAQAFADDFVVGGTSSEELYGVCEAMYKKNMEPDQLFETISQCLLAAVDRDCLAGWGAQVHILTPTKHITKILKSRKD
eukprot:TRINITY_DN8862_c0_g1_i1.p1 TRINITY_DN8862_c0_g1~~TRINITY_DN8862_c0_g1_i1.p1  ORF type:complete len:227 (+),score=48.77 TRINITY_DN8862_c0_g1_i1:54-683(+)